MIVYKCDCCEAEIPLVKKRNLIGDEVEVLDRGFLECKEYDFTSFNHNLSILMCKSCAEKISAQLDYEILKFKSDALAKR